MADDNRIQHVSLGCGTLILIAVIVLIFSGRNVGDLEHEVQGLRFEVRELKKAVDGQLEAIQEKLDRLQPVPGKIEGTNPRK